MKKKRGLCVILAGVVLLCVLIVCYFALLKANSSEEETTEEETTQEEVAAAFLCPYGLLQMPNVRQPCFRIPAEPCILPYYLPLCSCRYPVLRLHICPHRFLPVPCRTRLHCRNLHRT